MSFYFQKVPEGVRETEILLQHLSLDADKENFADFRCVKIFNDLVPQLAKQLENSILKGAPTVIPANNGNLKSPSEAFTDLLELNDLIRQSYQKMGVGFLLEGKFIVHGAQFFELERVRRCQLDRDLTKAWPSIRTQLLKMGKAAVELLEESDEEGAKETIAILKKSMTALPQNNSDAAGIRAFLNDYQHFSLLDELQALSLMSRGLESIPLELNCFKNLKNLSVHKNQIVEIPGYLNTWNITTLKADENQIQLFPNCQNLSKLTHLFMSRNQIRSIPDFDQFPELITLNLEHNPITALPAFTHVPHLSALFLTAQIEDLSSLSHLEDLATLTINGKRLRNRAQVTAFLQQ